MDSEDFLVFHSSMIGKCLFLILEENSLIVTVIIPYNDQYVIKEEPKWIIFSINHHSLLIMSPNNSYCSPHVSFYLSSFSIHFSSNESQNTLESTLIIQSPIMVSSQINKWTLNSSTNYDSSSILPFFIQFFMYYGINELVLRITQHNSSFHVTTVG